MQTATINLTGVNASSNCTAMTLGLIVDHAEKYLASGRVDCYDTAMGCFTALIKSYSKLFPSLKDDSKLGKPVEFIYRKMVEMRGTLDDIFENEDKDAITRLRNQAGKIIELDALYQKRLTEERSEAGEFNFEDLIAFTANDNNKNELLQPKANN